MQTRDRIQVSKLGCIWNIHIFFWSRWFYSQLQPCMLGNKNCDHGPNTDVNFCSVHQMDESLSPAPATTAEEAMASSGDKAEKRPPPVENRALSGDAPAQGPTGREEAAPEVEPWAAAVPPVRRRKCLWGRCTNGINSSNGISTHQTVFFLKRVISSYFITFLCIHWFSLLCVFK